MFNMKPFEKRCDNTIKVDLYIGKHPPVNDNFEKLIKAQLKKHVPNTKNETHTIQIKIQP